MLNLEYFKGIMRKNIKLKHNLTCRDHHGYHFMFLAVFLHNLDHNLYSIYELYTFLLLQVMSFFQHYKNSLKTSF